MSDDGKPIWTPTFDIGEYVRDPDWAAKIASVKEQFGCTQYEAFMLVLLMVNTSCNVWLASNAMDDDDDIPEWEKR